MKKYFLHDGSQQAGPFDIEDLSLKNLTKDTPIWYDGLSEWTTVGKIEELKDLVKPTPPLFGSTMATPPPVQKPIAQLKISADKPKQISLKVRGLLIIGGVIILILIGTVIYNQMQHQQYQQDRENRINSEEDTKSSIKNNITSYVTAERNEYTYSEMGGISNLKISVTNSTDYVLDNVRVKVIYIKANGEVWDSKMVDFNMINPQSKSTIKVGDTERGTSVQYEIVSIKSNALGLN